MLPSQLAPTAAAGGTTRQRAQHGAAERSLQTTGNPKPSQLASTLEPPGADPHAGGVAGDVKPNASRPYADQAKETAVDWRCPNYIRMVVPCWRGHYLSLRRWYRTFSWGRGQWFSFLKPLPGCIAPSSSASWSRFCANYRWRECRRFFFFGDGMPIGTVKFYCKQGIHLHHSEG
jgi:hypothetical protein